MTLHISVLSAANVPNAETFGKSDPYVRLEFRGQFNLCVTIFK